MYVDIHVDLVLEVLYLINVHDHTHVYILLLIECFVKIGGLTNSTYKTHSTRLLNN